MNLQPYIDRFVVLDKAKTSAEEATQAAYDNGLFQLTVDIMKERFPQYNPRLEDDNIAWDCTDLQNQDVWDFLENFRDECFKTLEQ